MTDFINAVIEQVAGALETVIGFLPSSVMILDFDSLKLGNIPIEWIQYINYFFPLQEILWFLEMVAAFFAVYYGRSVILRLFRLIK